MAGLFLLLVIFVPLIAVGYNTALAMRMYDAKHRHIGTLVIGFVPWLATVWVFSVGYVVSNTGMSGSAHFAVSLAMYFAVLTSLWAHIDSQTSQPTTTDRILSRTRLHAFVLLHRRS